MSCPVRVETARPASAAPDSAAIGVDPVHERVYRYLVRRVGRSPATSWSQNSACPPASPPAVLRKLEGQALVTRTEARPPGYVVSPPELALESLRRAAR